MAGSGTLREHGQVYLRKVAENFGRCVFFSAREMEHGRFRALFAALFDPKWRIAGVYPKLPRIEFLPLEDRASDVGNRAIGRPEHRATWKPKHSADEHGWAKDLSHPLRPRNGSTNQTKLVGRKGWGTRRYVIRDGVKPTPNSSPARAKPARSGGPGWDDLGCGGIHGEG